MKIMYVEDNPANIALMQRIARMGGHDVTFYTEGEKALAHIERETPDLLLMDLQLAGQLSGLEVVRILRKRGYKMPIIAVTAYAMVGDKEKCLEAGCDGYLAKPLPVTELVELVQQHEANLKAKTPAPVEAPPVAAAVPPDEAPTTEIHIPTSAVVDPDQTRPDRTALEGVPQPVEAKPTESATSPNGSSAPLP